MRKRRVNRGVIDHKLITGLIRIIKYKTYLYI